VSNFGEIDTYADRAGEWRRAGMSNSNYLGAAKSTKTAAKGVAKVLKNSSSGYA